MTDDTNKDDKKTEEKKKSTLSLGGGTLSLKNKAAAAGGNSGLVQQSFSGGRSKTVAVEVRRRRGGEQKPAETTTQSNTSNAPDPFAGLTQSEREARMRALEAAKNANGMTKSSLPPRVKKAEPKEDEPTTTEAQTAPQAPTPDAAPKPKKTMRQREMEELQRRQEEERLKAEELRVQQEAENEKRRKELGNKFPNRARETEDDGLSMREKLKRNAGAQKKTRATPDRWSGGKITVSQALAGESEFERMPSLASQKRARQKQFKKESNFQAPTEKKTREIIVPETITVQELANRMAEKSGDVVKSLMKMGVMATINQAIDQDTAELIIDEYGHKVKRVSESDVEIDMIGTDDNDADMQPRPPVVTIMGHVDHGKTSLLDVMREANVVSGEAGGITQHIGAYQVQLGTGEKITFLDTPGHAAFTEMRARGANVTDIVIIVVAANDSIMPQTVEAISHAKAAGVPIIIAVNKVDLPDANPMKVKQDLLQHEIMVEDMGGEVLCIEVSAKEKLNLDKLQEAILLQAELMDTIVANPDRKAEGRVIEAKMEKGRGSVATVLIQRGTLNTGEIFVSGSEWGRVRAIIDDKNKQIKQAYPGQPVEILGLNGTPLAGDDFAVVDSEAKAREIVEYRERKKLEAKSVASTTGGFEALFAKAKSEGTTTVLPVLIKSDVQGSTEAIIGSLAKISEENPDVDVQVLHSGVGGITESDVTLAGASNAMIIGFNVRANAQARDLAQKNGVDVRYYSIIYNVIDDVKAMLSGMLSPNLREELIGYAEIRQVFNITKVGKVAGCMITSGFVKRGSKVRLLRDDVVIHEGKLKTLKRLKDEVKEVKEGTECGMAFEKYDDIKEGDIIECFDVIEEAREVA
jgi:translation initiation factor IF-2